jgi:hypothetical protein
MSRIDSVALMPSSRSKKTRRLPVAKTLRSIKKRGSFLWKKTLNLVKRASVRVRKMTRRSHCRR